MNDTDKLVEAQFNRLPPQLQAALKTVPWKSSVKEIASAKNLTPEQAEALERETMFILYGFENPEDYISNIVREVQISEEVAAAIAEAVNEKVFTPIAREAEKVSEPQTESNHANLPMVEPGEVVHDVPHVEQPANAPAPVKPEIKSAEPAKPAYVPLKSDYPGGQDPYREPLV